MLYNKRDYEVLIDFHDRVSFLAWILMNISALIWNKDIIQKSFYKKKKKVKEKFALQFQCSLVKYPRREDSRSDKFNAWKSKSFKFSSWQVQIFTYIIWSYLDCLKIEVPIYFCHVCTYFIIYLSLKDIQVAHKSRKSLILVLRTMNMYKIIHTYIKHTCLYLETCKYKKQIYHH